MRNTWISGGLIASLTLATPALAEPVLDEVYGASVERGQLELESTYAEMRGGPDHGENGVKLEAAYGVNDRLRIAGIAEFEREQGGPRRAEEVGIEAIYELGSAGGIDFAAYGEYAFGLNGNADKIEAKLLVQHKHGPLDVRFNLIAEKGLRNGERVELGYAASADVEAVGEFRLGVQAFGGLGTFDDALPRADHYVGPVVKTEIEGLGPEIGLQAGYLFALGKARDDTDGQFRLMLEMEF